MKGNRLFRRTGCKWENNLRKSEGELLRWDGMEKSLHNMMTRKR
jgi:hypothetical protein